MQTAERWPYEALIDVFARAYARGDLSRERALNAASLIASSAPSEIREHVQRRFSAAPEQPTRTAPIGGRFYTVKDAAPLRGQTVDGLRAEIRRSNQTLIGNAVRVDLDSGWYASRQLQKKVWRVWVPQGGVAT
jgi:hypothetical protein